MNLQVEPGPETWGQGQSEATGPETPMSLNYPEGPSTQIVGFQGPKTIQSMDFGT